MTDKTDYYDTYCFSGPASVIRHGEDAIGKYWLFDKTIFHPQGGGQPSDVGMISLDRGTIEITSVKELDGELRHYGIGTVLPVVGETVTQKINSEFRILCARFHSAGHLLAQVVEQQLPSAVAQKAFHFLEGPYVEVAGIVPSGAIAELQQAVDAVSGNTPITTINGNRRVVQIGTFPAVACGGTHLKNTGEIGKVIIRGIKKSGTNSRIKYIVDSTEPFLIRKYTI